MRWRAMSGSRMLPTTWPGPGATAPGSGFPSPPTAGSRLSVSRQNGRGNRHVARRTPLDAGMVRSLVADEERSRAAWRLNHAWLAQS